MILRGGRGALADDNTPTKGKNADLPARVASAIVMIAVAGTAIWLGGWWWFAFIVIVAGGVMSEWHGLVLRFVPSMAGRIVWIVAGIAYALLASLTLVSLRLDGTGYWLLVLILGVIGVDVGAYFMGRAIGGPKIAPSISPSKTWAGLAGGVVGAYVMILGAEVVSTAAIMAAHGAEFSQWVWLTLAANWGWALGLAALFAVVAQAGDFFESWMKRRAGVKDSSNLIPGHGGLFDRTDGLMAVSAVLGIVQVFTGGIS